MRSSRQLFALGISLIIILSLTAKLDAVVDNNSQCGGGGGCWTACKSSGNGSSELIGASQTPECSPAPMSSCTGGSGEVICGVQYSYSSNNCDPATITNSYYSYSNPCSP